MAEISCEQCGCPCEKEDYFSSPDPHWEIRQFFGGRPVPLASFNDKDPPTHWFCCDGCTTTWHGTRAELNRHTSTGKPPWEHKVVPEDVRQKCIEMMNAANKK